MKTRKVFFICLPIGLLLSFFQLRIPLDPDPVNATATIMGHLFLGWLYTMIPTGLYYLIRGRKKKVTKVI